VIYFYDNAGTLKGTVDQATSGALFDTGRGDGTRIFGHINRPYVYLTGRAANTEIVKVAAFDSRNQKFVAIGDVNEGAFTGNFDRANGASDALDRLTVSWVSQPAGYTKQQVAARVLSFDGTNFTALTASFFPFINTGTNDIRSLDDRGLTTKQICIAAKGEINYQNKPELGPDSPTEVNFYTVFTHPNPQDDPTTPVGGGAPQFSSIKRNANGTITVEWSGGGTLEAAPAVTGPWLASPRTSRNTHAGSSGHLRPPEAVGCAQTFDDWDRAEARSFCLVSGSPGARWTVQGRTIGPRSLQVAERLLLGARTSKAADGPSASTE
jgi:hypothetical protein